MNENNTLASEIIAELSKQIKMLNTDINVLRIIFRAVHYATVNGGISEAEAIESMSGIQTMIDVLKDNADETVGICNS